MICMIGNTRLNPRLSKVQHMRVMLSSVMYEGLVELD